MHGHLDPRLPQELSKDVKRFFFITSIYLFYECNKEYNREVLQNENVYELSLYVTK